MAMSGEDGRTGPLDLDLLARQTLGDRELEAELFALFEAQAERLFPVIAGEGSAAARSEAAHSLKGASAAIGAVEVMRLAGALELAFGGASGEQLRLVRSLGHALGEARLAIDAWRRARGAALEI